MYGQITVQNVKLLATAIP